MRANKQVLIIVIATFLTLVLWVIFDVIHARSDITISPQVQSVLEPISPNFDTRGIEQL